MHPYGVALRRKEKGERFIADKNAQRRENRLRRSRRSQRVCGALSPTGERLRRQYRDRGGGGFSIAELLRSLIPRTPVNKGLGGRRRRPP